MPRKAERIRRSAEIKGILKYKKHNYHTPLLKIIAKENKEETPRFVVICKKSIGGAVKRNRARRIINAAILRIRHKIKKNYDYVIFPKELSTMNKYLVEIEGVFNEILT